MNCVRGSRWLYLAALASVFPGAQPGAADRLELVRYTSLWSDSSVRSADASGVTYLPDSGRLLIADSEISEYGDRIDPATGRVIFDGHNVFATPLAADRRLAAFLVTPPDRERSEPVGIVYNPVDGHVYVTDDDQKRIFRYRFDAEQGLGGALASAATSFDGRYTDPEGITCDPRSGELFVVSGTKHERVLRFRHDAAADTFAFLGDFDIDAHIHDPEGIGFDPVSGHLFAVSVGGIAELTVDGAFVQFFDYGFLADSGVTLTVPGGLTFAPSSDPNDPADTQSLYVTCRGVDNGAFPKRNSLDGGLAELRLMREPLLETALRVPADHATVQAAVDAAADGDTILVAPGVYRGAVDLGDKRLALVSEHFRNGEASAIATTIIDGDGGDFALRIGDPEAPRRAGERPLVWGFTIRNAGDGITATVAFDLLRCRVTQTSDGIDYEAGGGLVRACRFDGNRDDAIDLDGPTAAVIEHCELVDNGDDGIEIRLHAYDSPDSLDILVRDNLIRGNGEDGIQLIGYDVETARRFRIEGNRIIGNAMAGIGLMSGANTREDYEAAPLPEAFVIAHNTFVDNDHHIAGGARVLVVNNLFVGARTVALKGVGGGSRIINNLLWANEADAEGMAYDASMSIMADPGFAANGYGLTAQSPAVDAGRWLVTWQGGAWRVQSSAEVRGEAPDLGALERR